MGVGLSGRSTVAQNQPKEAEKNIDVQKNKLKTCIHLMYFATVLILLPY